MTRCFEWVSADIFPNDGTAPILYRTANDKLGVMDDTGVYLDNWFFLKEKYNIKWWVYQDCLL